MAEERNTSVSKFIIGKVLDSLTPDTRAREELLMAQPAKEVCRLKEEKQKIEEENTALRKENRMLGMLSDNLDRENRRLKAQPFTEAGFVGARVAPVEWS
jgi:hypothetical protein